MKYLYCDVNMFELNHDIILVDSETGENQYLGSAFLDNLMNFIYVSCLEYNLHQVKISCDKTFAEGLILSPELQTNFNQNNIEIEVLSK